jgi:very-short-patch-repair endonuclease
MIKLTTKQFISKAKLIHGDKYDYSLVDYVNNSTKIKIICLTHNIFKQTPQNHLNKNGCPICSHIDRQKTRISNKAKIFRKRISKINPDIIILSEYKGCRSLINVQCKKCNHNWKARPNNLLNGKGCGHCTFSKGEITIERFLKEHNIKYSTQYRFPKCKNKKPLPFDFYLPEHKLCIEYDGIQHFRPVQFKDMSKEKAIESFINTKHNDNIKTKYCKQKGIGLLRIPYTSNGSIKIILTNRLSRN